jgi:hypothetical protein
MKTQPITEKQTEIILYLYQFRFLNTHQIQQLLNHKNANGILLWLRDLIEKKYIKRRYNKSSLEEKSKPAIYYLRSKARFVLKVQKNLVDEEVEYIYQEHKRDKKFIEHCLFIADIYLFMRKQQDINDEIKFFTAKELRRYEYFPQPLPDAFIAIKNNDTTRRFFLDYFDQYTPSFVLRQRIKQYINYSEESEWYEKSDNTPFPYLLFVCSNNKAKNHIKLYSKAVLEKTYTDNISMFVTTKTTFNKDILAIWEKV